MALTTDKISLKNIISKVYRDFNIDEEYDVVNIIEWAVEALRFIGAYQQLERKTTCINICNYRAEVPCDLVALLEVEYEGIQLDKGSNHRNFRALRGSYLTGPYAYNQDRIENVAFIMGQLYSFNGKENFIMQNGWFKTSFKEGNIKIVYNSLPMDEEGFPLVPDNESYREAIKWFIGKNYMYHKAIKDSNMRWFYQDAEQKWQWYCNQAGAQAMMPDIYTLENIKRNFIQLLPKVNSYKVFFNDLNQPTR